MDRGPIKFYIASKAKHRPRWRELRDNPGGYNIISRWIDVDDDHLDRDPGPDFDFKKLWTECVEDVINCDVLICHVEKDEVLKGALIEVGVALAMNKRIICCGKLSAYKTNGTWIHHPGIEYTAQSINYVLWGLSLG